MVLLVPWYVYQWEYATIGTMVRVVTGRTPHERVWHQYTCTMVPVWHTRLHGAKWDQMVPNGTTGMYCKTMCTYKSSTHRQTRARDKQVFTTTTNVSARQTSLRIDEELELDTSKLSTRRQTRARQCKVVDSPTNPRSNKDICRLVDKLELDTNTSSNRRHTRALHRHVFSSSTN
jgi:hypothetical protein